MNVVIADIDLQAAESVAAELVASGVDALPVHCDVADTSSVTALANAVFAGFDDVAILCNNAGVVFNRPLTECTSDDWHWIFGVNLFGAVHCVDAFLPRMLSSGSPGHIVNTAAGAGLTGGRPAGLRGAFDTAVYTVSKHAVVAYTEQLAAELADSAIHVSVLCPGKVRTRIAESERSRSADFGPPVSAPSARQALAAALADGLDPRTVGDITRDGVQRGLLYIMTHYARDGFLHRVTSVLEDFAFAPDGPYAVRAPDGSYTGAT
jgi:NAD(P)-dependent dehydrogenase (short-subunit alcohol dehydrogenase family)